MFRWAETQNAVKFKSMNETMYTCLQVPGEILQIHNSILAKQNNFSYDWQLSSHSLDDICSIDNSNRAGDNDECSRLIKCRYNQYSGLLENQKTYMNYIWLNSINIMLDI